MKHSMTTILFNYTILSVQIRINVELPFLSLHLSFGLLDRTFS